MTHEVQRLQDLLITIGMEIQEALIEIHGPVEMSLARLELDSEEEDGVA